jgi:WD40 repeat protein
MSEQQALAHQSVPGVEKENPFVGPRPFTAADSARFRGREREARDLLSLVISERLVLFYSQSGAGKSSLINASLAPSLRARGFHVLPVGRVSGRSDGETEVKNIFIYDLLLSLEGGSADEERLAQLSLMDYLDELETPQSGETEEQARREGVTPLVLIIDQFEEIFTNHPEAYEKREDFFEQVAEAMENDPYLWVVFAIREDFVAGLDGYAHLLPGQMRGRFYMQRLRQDAATRAVTEPARGIRPIDEDTAGKLVENLRQVVASGVAAKRDQPPLGEFIEPVQLQVVCYQLWERAARKNIPELNMEVLPDLLEGRTLADFVSQALADFYENVIEFTMESMRQRGQPISQRKLRDWFSDHLITPAGTRAFVFGSRKSVEGMPTAVVELLVSRHIIRSESRASATWYELVHDRMVDPIVKANEAWRSNNTSQLQKDAAIWNDNKDNRTLLYSGRQLREGEELFKKGELEGSEREFVRESLKEEKAEVERQRVEVEKAAARRRMIAGGAVVLVLMIALSIFAVLSAADANKQKVVANTASTRALAEQRNAEAASTRAFEQQLTAEAASMQAVAASNQAIEEKNEADAAKKDAQIKAEEARLAEEKALAAQQEADKAKEDLQVTLRQSLNSRLAAYAEYYGASDEDHDLSLLLSVAALRLDGGRELWETYKAVSSAVWGSYDLQPYQAFLNYSKIPSNSFMPPGEFVFSLAFSPDGQELAVAGRSGSLNLWSLGEPQPAPAPAPLHTTWRLYSVKYSNDGKYLATGGGEGVVKILDRASGQLYAAFTPPGSNKMFIHRLAFSPDSKYLAVGMGDGRVFLYDLGLKKATATRFERSGDVWSLAWAPNSTLLAFGGKDGSVTIWDTSKDASERPEQIPNFSNSTVDGLVWSPDGRYIYAGGQGKQIIKWDTVEKKVVVRSRRENTPSIFDLAIDKNGTTLISGNGSTLAPVTLWDTTSLSPVGFPGHHKNWSRAVAFDPTGKYLVSGGDDAAVFLWEIRGLEPLAKTVGRVTEGSIAAVGLDPEQSGQPVYLRTAGSSLRKFIQLFDHTFRPTGAQIPLNFNVLAFGVLDGRLALAAGAPGMVQLIDPRTGEARMEPIALENKNEIGAVAFSADGGLLGVSSCGDETQGFREQYGYCTSSLLTFWDISNPAEQPARQLALTVKYLDGKESTGLIQNHVTALAISPGGRVVLGYRYGQEGRILIGQLTLGPGRQGGRLEISTDAAVSSGLVNHIYFSPDGKIFATGTAAGDIRMWHSQNRQIYNFLGFETQSLNNVRVPVAIGGLAFYPGESGLRMYSITQHGVIRDWDVDLHSLARRACNIMRSVNEEEEWNKLFPDADKPAQICPYP